ncbi:MAG: restriction endonuclease subunit S [Oscillatoria sp. SIO1A7]|nr:restriction endonuclease subunit S [Oscillatoria sp. SIO1A7]
MPNAQCEHAQCPQLFAMPGFLIFIETRFLFSGFWLKERQNFIYSSKRSAVSGQPYALLGQAMPDERLGICF